MDGILTYITQNAFLRARSSRTWLVIGVVAVGARAIRRISRNQEVMYRTAIRPGDRFEVVATRRQK